MRLFLFFFSMLFISSIQAQITIEDFTHNPLQKSLWKTGGSQSWQWREGVLVSGKIADQEKTWIEFTTTTKTGDFTFEYQVSSQSYKDGLLFYIDGKRRGRFSGVMPLPYPETYKIEAGKHTFRWVYVKDPWGTEGEDCAYITKVSYPSQERPKISFTEVKYQDNESNFSYGNSDQVINTFETIRVLGEITNDSSQNLQSLKIAPQLPQDILLIVAPQPESLDIPGRSKVRFSFSFVVGNRFTEKSLQFPILIQNSSQEILHKYDFSAPFVKTDFAQRFLEKKNVFRDSQLHYISKENLDEFITRFPESDLLEIIFRFRLEYCNKFRDAVQEKNNKANSNNNRKANILRVVHEYDDFVQKYPDRMLARLAVHENFKLCRQMDDVTQYNQFIRKYPQTEHALVAKEHVKKVLFQDVISENTVSAFESFLSLYPEKSAYRERAFELAIEKAIEEEKALLDSLKTAQQIDDRIGELFQQILAVRYEYKAIDDPTERIQKCLSDTRIERIKKILFQVYQGKAARYLLIIETLDDLQELSLQTQKFLEQQQKEILQALDQHFFALNNNLQENFQFLEKQIQQMQMDLSEEFRASQEQIKISLTKIEGQVKGLEEGLKNLHSNVDASQGMLSNYLTKIDGHLEKISHTFIESTPPRKVPALLVKVAERILSPNNSLQILKEQTAPLENKKEEEALAENDLLWPEEWDEGKKTYLAQEDNTKEEKNSSAPPEKAPNTNTLNNTVNSTQLIYTGYQKLFQPIIKSSTPLHPTKPDHTEVFFVTDREQEGYNFTIERSSKKESTLGVSTISNPEIIPIIFRKDKYFYRKLLKSIDKSKSKEALVFIHGFNVPFDYAMYSAAQIKSSLQFDGPIIVYSWPSQGSVIHYMADKNTALWCGSRLQKLFIDLEEKTPVQKIHVIAHSMGNLVMTEALREVQGERIRRKLPTRKFGHIVMVAPDLDAGRFQQRLAEMIQVSAQKVTIYASSNDWALYTAKKLQKYPRVGDVDLQKGPYVIIPGIDTIDASVAESSFICHSHHEDIRVLHDIQSLLQGFKVGDRSLEEKEKTDGSKYWKIILPEAKGSF